MRRHPGTSLCVLNPGSCETLKAAFHGTATGLAMVMGLYNAAAWLRRREPHLAVNALIYGAAIVWECHHVARHWTARRDRPALRQEAGLLAERDDRRFGGDLSAASVSALPVDRVRFG